MSGGGGGHVRTPTLEDESRLAQPVFQSPSPWPVISLGVSMWPNTGQWDIRRDLLGTFGEGYFLPHQKWGRWGALFYLEALTFSLTSSHLWDISSSTWQASREQGWCLSHSFTLPVADTGKMFNELSQTCATHVCSLNKIILQPWSSVGDDFAPPPPLPAPGDAWQCLETFLVAMTGQGEGCYWHLVRRGQGCW